MLAQFRNDPFDQFLTFYKHIHKKNGRGKNLSH